MHDYWNMLHGAKLIGDKKYNNLMRSTISEQTMKGFVARQLVETSQMVKLVQSMLEVRYPETKIVPVKASISHNLREAAGFIKCREANDFHHAHDAYLALRVGMFIQKRHPGVYENPIGLTRAMRKYAQSQAEIFRSTHHLPGSAGFIVNSFMSSGFDKETGEIFKDDWDAEAEVEGIRRALNYRQCFISRMPYEDTGVFWDATIYSPRCGKNLGLPLKRHLDPKKYGSYSGKNYAYFFVYKEMDKRGKEDYQLAGVPIFLLSQLKYGESKLEDYARKLAVEKKRIFVGIEVWHILHDQLVEVRGDRLAVTGEEVMKNAHQLAFTQVEMELIKKLIENKNSNSSCNKRRITQDILNIIKSQANSVNCKLMSESIDILTIEKNFKSVPFEQQRDILLGIIRAYRGGRQSRPIDLSCLGGAKNAGRLRPARTKLPSDFYIIDQSVTGMFERRTRIGL